MQDKFDNLKNNTNGGDGDVGTGSETGGLVAGGGTSARGHGDNPSAGRQDGMRSVSAAGTAGEMRIGREIPYDVKLLLENLKLMQAQIDALPGPRLHQDHDFDGERENLETLFGWLYETAWTPYWGDPNAVDSMLFLGGRDPWIETLELRLWDTLDKLAIAAGCELTGRGAVCPEDDELQEIHVMYPQIAEANGWVFSRQGDVVQ